MEHLSLDAPTPASRADWEREAAAVLRKSGRLGADDPDAAVWGKLARTTLDGLAITPLGTAGDVPPAWVRPRRVGAWDIRGLADGVDARSANAVACADLEGGVTSLWVTSDGDLAVVLAGVLLDIAPVVLDTTRDPVDAATDLVGLAVGAGVRLDPRTNLGADAAGDVDALVTIARLAGDSGVLGVVVDATVAHERGAGDVQELGYSLAVAVGALRTLVGAGLSVEEAAGLVEFRYAATDEQFPTIAKLRAARRLWARALELSGVSIADGVEQRQHVVTSRAMLSRYDPNVNMLRATIAAFAAGVGGADAVTVLPFDAAGGRPGELGRRIARNVSHLLIDESHVAVVSDPAGGSYAVERLTADLAEAAWAVFQGIERDGLDPFWAAVAETAARRDALVATRRRPITGLTEFPDPGESPLVREPDPAADAVRRYGAAFEALRDAPAAQPVFLATIGTVAEHTARATFASNLLAAGGIGVVSEYGGERVAMLAGTDAAYAEQGAAVAADLRAKGVAHVIVAGRPTEWADDSAVIGVDALAFLTRVREELAR